MSSEDVWIFAFGSVMWDQGNVQPIEEKVGYLPGWHRDWMWISKGRGGAPTCSLHRGGKVKGKFFRLNPETKDADLEYFRKREVRSSEENLTVDDIPGKVHFWTMGNNLEAHEDTRGLKGIKLYEALAKRAKTVFVTGSDGKTPEEYALAVHNFDPDDEITKTYVNELLKLSESEEERDSPQVIQAISKRMGSLKANRNFFTILFAIQSAMLTIMSSFTASRVDYFWIPFLFLIPSLALTLFAIFSLTDSIHFYSKYVEHRYAWSNIVHGIVYSKPSVQKATDDFKRALNADDIGYYYLKLSLLTFLWFLSSTIYIVPITLDLFSKTIVFILSAFLLAYITIKTYQATHRKKFSKSAKDFFVRKPVFKKTWTFQKMQIT